MTTTFSKRVLWASACLLSLSFSQLKAESNNNPSTDSQPNSVKSALTINPTTVDVVFANNDRMSLDFYGENIFRLFQDNSGGVLRSPQATPPAEILVASPRAGMQKPTVEDSGDAIAVKTQAIEVDIDKATGLLKVTNLETGKVVMEMLRPVRFDKNRVTMTLKANPDEYFYGGGVQNGRFSHKGKVIAIENQNSWTDGGVASPTPFYWSTGGYGIMWYTFQKGKYDFGAANKGEVTLMHETPYLDAFVMVDEGAVSLLNDFYQLTGHPVLIPKFGFYQGHLNAYNRDFWKEDENGIPFEDGKKYKESQKDNGGIKESLNGEKDNYQFSARAVVDRYKSHDMPLGWILPNDGYGAGYGQTETLDGNIQNLKEFGDYARENGVEIGLWTQSDLHPKEGISALLQRDIVKEVRDAGVRVLKTDVAWVGAGYSFGLNGVADVGQIMPYYGNNARPFIISLDGWAGTQRYATIWSGDQTGGEWEYIRFHIPTYIGSGLSGQPSITSDMDGIFGGRNTPVNVRDFQWKAFTMMQLNMDGWGSNEKYPHALGEPAESINRSYLKLKSELLPYAYTFSHEAIDGLPLMRAMMLEYPNDYTKGSSTQYQYMFGPSLLVAPVYQETKADEQGNDIRNGIYLPEGEWLDYFTGTLYDGSRILNDFDAPLWKIPLFVKAGAIIPMSNPSNNVKEIDNSLRIYDIYPSGHSSVTEYDDDGITEMYRNGESVRTFIESDLNRKNLTITIHPSEGSYEGFVSRKATELRINLIAKPSKVTAYIGNRKVTPECVYEEEPLFTDSAKSISGITVPAKAARLVVRIGEANVLDEEVKVIVEKCRSIARKAAFEKEGKLSAPNVAINETAVGACTLSPSWTIDANSDYYEIMFNGMLYTTIKDSTLLFDALSPDTEYSFDVRAVNGAGPSDWTTVKARTKTDPLEYAIHGIKAQTTAEAQEGFEVSRLFDFAESGDVWHTKYRVTAVPFDMIMDLRSVNHLDKLQYLPRKDGGNGTILKGSIFTSLDKKEWTAAGEFDWKRNGETKEFTFAGQPTARYVKICVSEGVGNYGSGRELYVFKVPGSQSYIPGDVNNDGKIDSNDLTSYMNYTGLRIGDSDFEGYISNGDINRNGLIDAYDISHVSTLLEDGVSPYEADSLQGKMTVSADRQKYAKDDEMEIVVKGDGLRSVNAFSFAIPYDPEVMEFEGTEYPAIQEMENLTYDRLHTNGEKVLYVTFVNVGDKPLINGDDTICTLKFKIRHNCEPVLEVTDGLLVDKDLNTLSF